jgi:hypothetical protein
MVNRSKLESIRAKIIIVAIVIGYFLKVLTNEESLILIIAMKHVKEDKA